MKRILSLFLVVTMLFSYVGCVGYDSQLDDGALTTQSGGAASGTQSGDSDDKESEVPEYKVTLKNSDGVIFDETVVSYGSKIVEPKMPEVEGYTFVGWFDNLDSKVPFDFETPIKSDLELVAKWNGGKAPQVGIEPVKVASDYQITGLFVDADAGTISAELYAESDCGIVVKFAEEHKFFTEGFDTNPEYIEGISAKGDIIGLEKDELIKVELTFDATLPKYFVTVAILVDADGNALSEQFSSIDNTYRFEAFDNKTVEDFEGEERLIVFDRGNTSFGVLTDDVRMLNAISASEVALNDCGNSFYRIIGLSENISQGEKVYIKLEDGTELLFKVESVRADEDGVTVVPAKTTPDDGYGLSDFYKFLKVDMSIEGEVNQDEGAELMSSENPKKEKLKLDFEPFKLEIDEKVELNGNFMGIIWIFADFKYDPLTLGWDYFECSVSLVSYLDFEATVKVKVNNETFKKDKDEESLFKLPVPPLFAGFSPTLEFGAFFAWELTGSVTVNIKVDKTLGFSYNPIEGFTKINIGDGVDSSVDFDASATLLIGPKLSFGIEFLEGLVSAELVIERGVELTATTEEDERFVEAGARHDCYECLRMSIDDIWRVGAELTVGIPLLKHKVEWKPLSLTIYSVKYNIAAAHVSKATEDGEFVFSEGECENYTARFLVWNKTECACYSYNLDDDPNNDLTIDNHYTAWDIYIYDGDTLIGSFSKEKDEYHHPPNAPILLKFSQTYTVVVKEKCSYDLVEFRYEEGERYEVYTPMTSESQEVYIGECRLVYWYGEWTCRFGVKQPDGTWFGIRQILRPDKITE